MGCGMSTVEYREDEKDPLIPRGFQSTSTWQRESRYEPMYEPKLQPFIPSQKTNIAWQYEPKPQPIIPTQKPDSTYKVALSTCCITCCHLKGQGNKCSIKYGKAWMLKRLVSVSTTALQLAVDAEVYGMKEFQNYLQKHPNDVNPRVQLRGDFCALFRDSRGHPGPEKYVEAVVEEALSDDKDRSLSPCRLGRDMMGYDIRGVRTWEEEDDRGKVFVIQPRME